MKYIIATILLLITSTAFATWSIIIIDSKTGMIGIAGASCSPNCYGIGKIIPGVGAIIVQAMSNSEARAKGVQMILANATPQEVVEALRDPSFDPERQQYAVLTMQHLNPATYTGNQTHTFNGALTAPGISVQGNTLTTDSVLQKVMHAVLNAQQQSMSFNDVLMEALEAGSKAGGDNRCGEQRATSAFITVFGKDDKPNKPSIDLNTFGQHAGGPNAVTLLRKRYDKWKRKNS